MKDNELQFDRSCHVLYSKPCKKAILAKIALHYPAAERETLWKRHSVCSAAKAHRSGTRPAKHHAPE